MVNFPGACLNSSSYASILNTSLETSMTWTFLQTAEFFLHLKGGVGAAYPLFLSGVVGEPEFCAVPGGWSTWEGHRGSPGRIFHSFRAARSSGSQDCRPEPLPVFMGTSVSPGITYSRRLKQTCSSFPHSQTHSALPSLSWDHPCKEAYLRGSRDHCQPLLILWHGW